ncbi:MAG: ComEA family DNA-binding protein [Alcanivorax sp.]|nr:ComEA family DNA-binding protein [Alcanivorax sp.]
MRLFQSLLAITLLVFSLNPAMAASTASPKPHSTQASAVVGKININTADAGQLQKLKGVGPKTAQAIIDWRKQQGPFKTTDQLLAIKGIGEKTLAGMRSQIKVQ